MLKYEMWTEYSRIQIRCLNNSFQAYGITKYLVLHRALHVSNFSMKSSEN